MKVMYNVFALSCLALLLCCCLDSVNSAPAKVDNRGHYTPHKDDSRGRYNPQLHDPAYFKSYRSKYPNYYANRQFYDNFFKKYNPRVVAAMAKVLSQEIANPDPNGVYEYSYETENGIHGEERGVQIVTGVDEQHEHVAGTYSFLAPEGVRVTVKYSADDKGYHPIITYDGVNAARYINQPQPAGVVIAKVF